MHTTPLGFPDHRPFLGFSDELVYGLATEGDVRHISQVLRGLKCACRCPACNRPLVAKKGPKTLHHFAHQEGSDPCSRVAETNAHLWAKEVLGRVKQITLPALILNHKGRREIVSPERVYKFSKAKLEKRLDTIIPDVILETHDGVQLIVEVRVTHPCDEAKIEKLRADNLSAIEIDLRHYRTSGDRGAVEIALLSGARREWLHNAKVSHFADRLRERDEQRRMLQAQLADARAREEAAINAEREKREAIELARDLDRIVHAVRTMALQKSQRVGPVNDPMMQFGASSAADMRSVGFTTPNQTWQAELATKFLTYPDALDWQVEPVTVAHAMRVVSDHIIPSFNVKITPPLRDRLRTVFPRRLVPSEAIEMFFDLACSEGYLEGSDGEYRVSEGYARTLAKRAAERRAYEGRRERIGARIAELVSHLPRRATEDFSQERWFMAPQCNTGLSPDAICRTENQEAFREFDEQLKLIESMSSGGEPVVHLLNLPIQDDVKLAHIRKRDAALQTAARRRGDLLLAANAGLEQDADAWLSAPCEEDEELARIDYAGESETSLAKMYQALAVATRERHAEICARVEAQACRNELRATAAKIYDADHLKVFLNAFDKRLGNAPDRHCVDRRTLNECLALLPRNRRISKRGH